MYFLGKLEKMLQGEVKEKEITPPRVVESEEKSYVKKKDFTKNSSPKNNKEYKKPWNPNPAYEKKEFSNKSNKHSEGENNCFGLWAKDGDTFEAMFQKKRATFRLAGIDSPEKGQAFFWQAKKFLEERIKNKVVFLEFKGVDPYDRQIVEVYLDKNKQQSLNKMILAEGFATSERYTNNEGEQTHNIVEHLSNKITEAKASFQDKGMWGTPECPTEVKAPPSSPPLKVRKFGKDS